ncbi:MAG TPA: hypothetical protein QF468_01750 [Nitrospinota bacterium]|jgi:acyl carrier protein|nr:hypothetical protein [Nitrospinota bacterium]|tara:strand:+ start:70 stop:369 length:300 start_codon:yes stop_codon:yes gene_type:complete
MERKEVIYLIYGVIDKVNELLPDEQKLTKSENTKLYGTDGQLDSLGMVNFIVALEQKIEEDNGMTAELVNETTMSLNESPFQNVNMLTNYLHQLLNEGK